MPQIFTGIAWNYPKIRPITPKVLQIPSKSLEIKWQSAVLLVMIWEDDVAQSLLAGILTPSVLIHSAEQLLGARDGAVLQLRSQALRASTGP